MRRSTLLVSLTTVLAIGFLVKLGFWQLDRAAEKQTLFDDFAAAKTQADAVDFTMLPRRTESLDRYQPVQLNGSFIDGYLLLDNQIYQGQAGYHVIGLLSSNDRPQLVPVNMGWVPVGLDNDLSFRFAAVTS